MDAYLSRLKDIASSATRSASAVAIATTSKVVDSIQGKLARDYKLSSNAYSKSGLWSLYFASSVKTGKDVTVWMLDKKSLNSNLTYNQYGDGSFGVGYPDKNDFKNVLDFFKREVSQLSKLRHPSILRVIEPIEDTKNNITFVTEKILYSLETSQAKAKISKEYDLDNIEFTPFSHFLIKLLFFSSLDYERHTTNNEWFGYARNLENTSSFKQFDDPYLLPVETQRNLDYSAPELILNDLVLDKNDIYSIGCVLYSLYNNCNSIIKNTKNNLHDYEKKIAKIKNQKNIDFSLLESEPNVIEAVSSLVAYNYDSRVSIDYFMNSNFFNNVYSKTLISLENAAQDSITHQATVLRQVLSLLPEYSTKIQTRKILPRVEMLLDFSLKHKPSLVVLDLIYVCISTMCLIIQNMSSDLYNTTTLNKLMSAFNFSAQCLGNSELDSVAVEIVLVFLDKLQTIRLLARNKDSTINETIMPFLYDLLQKGNVIDSRILDKIYTESIPDLSKDLDKTLLCDELLPRIINQYKTTNKLVVKVYILKCFNMIADIFSSTVVNNQILPTIVKTKSRNLDLITLIVSLYCCFAINSKASIDILCRQVIPQCYIYLIEAQFDKAGYNAVVDQIVQISTAIHKRAMPEYDPTQSYVTHTSQTMDKDSQHRVEIVGSAQIDYDPFSKNSSTEFIGSAKASNSSFNKIPVPNYYQADSFGGATNEIEPHSRRLSNSQIGLVQAIKPMKLGSNQINPVSQDLKSQYSLNKNPDPPIFGTSSTSINFNPPNDIKSGFGANSSVKHDYHVGNSNNNQAIKSGNNYSSGGAFPDYNLQMGNHTNSIDWKQTIQPKKKDDFSSYNSQETYSEFGEFSQYKQPSISLAEKPTPFNKTQLSLDKKKPDLSLFDPFS
ncbi:Protein kinase domain-containing protein ppk32 [Smittium mucronatum]|uniref:Protein kinase domain-containing protein ppk32 n=1 Tax=Smittium mucronatum TaxID=133383 RepID=A0A1R0GNI6_9FUNG|nr:Protein kinase domain-containing protein ppk32 [Smittium mucronatum]